MFYNKLILCVVLVSSSIWGMEREIAHLKLDMLIEGLNKEKVLNKHIKGQECLLSWIILYKPESIDLFLLKEYRARGGNINHASSDTGECPIHYACLNGNISLIKNLIKCGADPKIKTGRHQSIYRSFETPLHYLCASKSYNITAAQGSDIIGWLVERGVDVNAQENGNENPFLRAMANDHVAICKQLIKYGANISDANLLKDMVRRIIGIDNVDARIFYAGLWLDQKRKPYLNEIVRALRKKVKEKELRKQICSYLPEYLPDSWLPKFYTGSRLAELMSMREAEKVRLVSQIWICAGKKLNL
jgi:hypothetical protein